MNNITHPELVRALVKSGADILNTLDQHKVNLWHAATGIAGEGGELLDGFLHHSGRENILEESGDLYFYIEQLVQGTQIQLDWEALYTASFNLDMLLEYGVQRVAIHSSEILDTVKKLAIYNKPLALPLLETQLEKLCLHLLFVGYAFNITHQDALDHNIAKLSKRYEGLKYSDQAAQERKDKV